MFKPITVALKGKGPLAFLKRVWSIQRRYGLTASKMDRSLAQLAQILRAFDVAATLPVTAVALERHSGLIRKYQDQGIEFAVHGYVHVDYSQLPLATQREHFKLAVEVFRNAGVQAVGFRCPYLRWNADTLTALHEAGLAFDSSNSLVWEIDARHQTESYHRALAFYGAQPAADLPALPALDERTGMVRLPYALPDDESLVERLRWDKPDEMVRVWPFIFEQIHRRGELFVLGLHPERIRACAPALTATLERVRAAGDEVWCARLGDIARWWTARLAARVHVTHRPDGLLQIAIDGPPGTTLLLRALEARTGTHAWHDGYRRADELPCVVRASRRPFIGASPETSPALVGFLRQQGYIVETTTGPDDYAFYLERRAFSDDDARALLARIEQDGGPLARLGRWPAGARSAFNVSGDIDALTLGDYFQRLRGK